MSSMANQTILFYLNTAFNEGFEVLPPKGHVTIHQKALFLVWIAAAFLWFYRKSTKSIQWEDSSQKGLKAESDGPINTSIVINVTMHCEETKSTDKVSKSTTSLEDALGSLCACGCIMIYYFFCDYMHYFPKSDRIYNRDLFIFLCLVLLLVAFSFSKTERGEDKLLNRDQTEEWKGWMQVMFVWYHYFKAAETYNAVRIYIAAYVWMTGFGNFSYLWVRKDYSIRRMLKVLFRLNFLVILTCLTVDNAYMLYYICAMHTFWYFTVYFTMRPFNHLNENPKVMIMKFTIYFILLTILYEIPGAASTTFFPFSFLFNYKGSLKEWIFRSRLDHYATFVGMICAYYHPAAESCLKAINKHKMEKLIIGTISFSLIFISYIWHEEVFVLTKYEYNALHPYTSWIPIITYIFLRNSTVWLRQRHLALFTFLGKITLETYISQLHIYLQANAKAIIVYFPGYPLINFFVNTGIYLFMAKILFDSTLTLNDYLFPEDIRKIVFNILSISIVVLFSYLINIVFA